MTGASLNDRASVQQMVTFVLDLLQRHPRARARVSSELGIKDGLELVMRTGYRPTPGQQTDIPADTWMVCPIDPSHCRIQLRTKGQRLLCPDHDGVFLVPEDRV